MATHSSFIVKLYDTNDKNEKWLIKYRQNRKEHKPWLEILDPEVMETSDRIINIMMYIYHRPKLTVIYLVGLYMRENKRKDRRRGIRILVPLIRVDCGPNCYHIWA
jgi:hypothetical protein